MSKRKLLTEWLAFEYTPEMITESREQNAGKILMNGILQKADTLNQNGRIYPGPILEREVRNYQKFIQENRALGELDHPDSAVINLANASHMITEVWMENKSVMGKAKVLNTPSGDILRSLVESGVTLGISSRGMGSVTESNGRTMVEEDFQLICFDFVSEPSTPGAFMMKEAKELKPNIFTKADRINRLLNEVLNDE